MAKTPRITGNNPPLHLWSQYPNWEYAYDEEGDEGQDETTIRPSINQVSIDEDSSFTAGRAVLATGQELPAMFMLMGEEVDSIFVYPNSQNDECWNIHPNADGQWKANAAFDGVGLLAPPIEGADIFPIRISSCMPLRRTGAKIEVVVSSIQPPGRQT